MAEPLTYDEIAEHKGHRLAVEIDHDAAAVVCDDCGEALVEVRRG